MKDLLNAYFSSVKTIHFIGICGIGMSGLAEMFHNLGFTVQGSDIKDSDAVTRLEASGIKVFIGHKVENINNADIVVVSSAISKFNVEYQYAKDNGILIFKRSKMLAELMRFKWGVSVAGTHGKTTTTSLISHIMNFNKMDPTAVIGGIVNSWNQNSRFGSSNWLIAESDESDGSFVELPSTIAVVTNIEKEHMEYYETYDALQEYFVRFVSNVPYYGFSVMCIDDPGVQAVMPLVRNNCKVHTYGQSPQADFRAKNIVSNEEGTYFDVAYMNGDHEEIIEKIFLPMYGMHNVLNSLAAIVVAINIKVEIDTIKEGLKTFEGISRRFTKIGEHDGTVFIDDYAHHPTEVFATINSAYTLAQEITEGKNKVLAIVQPHRYTRLKDQFDGFSKCFHQADLVLMLDVYTAGEEPIEGYNSQALVDEIKNCGHKHVFYIPSKQDLSDKLPKLIEEYNIKFTMFLGAGDISKIAKEQFKSIKEDSVEQ